MSNQSFATVIRHSSSVELWVYPYAVAGGVARLGSVPPNWVVLSRTVWEKMDLGWWTGVVLVFKYIKNIIIHCIP